MPEKSVRLIEYLIRVAALRTKLCRDINAYEKTLWFSSIPHDLGCYTMAWGQSEDHEQGEWLEVQNRREPELPKVPPPCLVWVDFPTLREKNGFPKLLPSITCQIHNPNWYDGSELPEEISITELLQNCPVVLRTIGTELIITMLIWIGKGSLNGAVGSSYASGSLRSMQIKTRHCRIFG